MTLSYHTFPARNGKAQSLVVLLHGFASHGEAMLPLAKDLSGALPDTAFVAPDAPGPVPGRPEGRMWFPIPELDGSSAEAADAQLLVAAKALDTLLDQLLVQTGLPPQAVALLGFSQGAGLAYQVGPRRGAQLGGVVAIAGRMKRKQSLPAETISQPPFLILTGADDHLLAAEETAAAVTALQGVGSIVTQVVMPGTGHRISQHGRDAATAFLQRHFAPGVLRA